MTTRWSLLCVPALFACTLAYHDGRDVALCWKQDEKTKERVRIDCEKLNLEFTNEWPETMVEGRNYTISFRATYPRGHKPVPRQVNVEGGSRLFDVTHANVHACQRKVGFCTPFVEETPGLATHTPAQAANVQPIPGGGHVINIENVASLEAGQYTIIAHVTWYDNGSEGTRYDMARAVMKDVEKAPNYALILTAAGLGGVLCVVLCACAQRRHDLQKARVRASEASAVTEARSRLIRVVMHDLRSPLLAVRNMADVLAEAPNGTKIEEAHVQRAVKAIQTCTTLMEGIVSDMLDFERIDSGRMELVLEPFSLQRLIADAELSFSPLAERRGVLLSVEPLPSDLADARLVGDRRRLLQCLGNGLSNAIKFSEEGQRVVVSARFVTPVHSTPHIGASSQEVCLSVRDFGAGMSQEELDVLSTGDAFAQVGRGQLQGNGGTGLGLNIVRAILDLHSGSTLDLRSDGHGCGSTFEMRLRLPAASPRTSLPGRISTATASSVVYPINGEDKLARCSVWASEGGTSPRRSFAVTEAQAMLAVGPEAASARVHEVGEASPAQASGGVVHCLHVEDDAMLQMTLGVRLFSRHGLVCEVAEDGQKAIDLVAGREARGQPQFDLIVMDNQMPRCNGSEATRRLREMGFSGVIVGMTGDVVGCPDRVAFAESGLSVCVDKTLEGMDEVATLIDQALLRAGGQQPRESDAHSTCANAVTGTRAAVSPQQRWSTTGAGERGSSLLTRNSSRRAWLEQPVGREAGEDEAPAAAAGGDPFIMARHVRVTPVGSEADDRESDETPATAAGNGHAGIMVLPPWPRRHDDDDHVHTDDGGGSRMLVIDV
mmetsp:Transcript_9552/g.28277  ORF Transcript_9552/g.28277 Transcript_9552/m.28277 type:complete len:832 (+) Transcript_9552:40-2535(+)